MVVSTLLLSILSLADFASALYIPHVNQPVDPTSNAAVDQRPREGTHDVSGARDPARAEPIQPIEYDGSYGLKDGAQTELKGIVSYAEAQDIIPDSYIVILKQTAPLTAMTSLFEWLVDTSLVQMETLVQTGKQHPLLNTETGFEIKRTYNIGAEDAMDANTVPLLRGYAAKLIPEVAELLVDHPYVALVERNFKLSIKKSKEEELAPWGLARVSHRDPLGFASSDKYLYDNQAGEGVTAYIVDTGIWTSHEDFENRARWGKNFVEDEADVDNVGHGSHCAGTIGGKRFGVAKKVNLVAVKVFNSQGQGQLSEMIAGIEYAVDSHNAEKKRKQDKFKGSTINFSAGSVRSPTMDLTFNAATEAGVHVAVAAGNSNVDACLTSPAAAKGPITVGATTITDERASFSNYGKCVDIFAPGVNVVSVGLDSPSASAVMSGTSMATPHITGLLSYFLSLQPTADSEYGLRRALTPEELKQDLISYGTTGVLKDIKWQSPNVIAFNGGGKDIAEFWNNHHSGNKASSVEDFAGTEQESVMGLIKGVLDDAQEILPLSF